MITVRREQFDALAQSGEESFESRLVLFLREQFPDSAAEDDTLFLQTIRQQIARARSFGFQTERQLATWLVSAWALGIDFDSRFPAAQGVLSSPLVTVDEKAAWLESWTRAMFESLEGQD